MRGFISLSTPTIANITIYITRLAAIRVPVTMLIVRLNVMILGYFKPLTNMMVQTQGKYISS